MIGDGEQPTYQEAVNDELLHQRAKNPPCRSALIELDAKHTFQYRDSSTCQSQNIVFDLNL